MQFSISDNMVSEFMSGLFAVFALIAVGAALLLIFTPLRKKFPFTRMALALALTPFSLIRFLDPPAASTLFLFSMISILLGITIDGINHVLTAPRRASKPTDARANEPTQAPPIPVAAAAPVAAVAPAPPPSVEEVPRDPGMMVWEKAE